MSKIKTMNKAQQLIAELKEGINAIKTQTNQMADEHTELQIKHNSLLGLMNQVMTDREIYRPDMETPERLAEYDELTNKITELIK